MVATKTKLVHQLLAVWFSWSQNLFCLACTGKARIFIQVHPTPPWLSSNQRPWDWCQYSRRASHSISFLREISNEWPSTILGVGSALRRRKLLADNVIEGCIYSGDCKSSGSCGHLCWLIQSNRYSNALLAVLNGRKRARGRLAVPTLSIHFTQKPTPPNCQSRSYNEVSEVWP